MAPSADLFNGDADGLCALHQLRMAEPRTAELITGTKRDIELFRYLKPDVAWDVTVLDVSLDRNRDGVLRLLQAGGRVHYFDHHAASRPLRHPRFEACIDQAADVCTSILVDRYLAGRYRPWACVAAFGDNLAAVGHELAEALGYTPGEAEILRELGELLNYNAYGETVDDLHLHPADLYRQLHPYVDPLVFARVSDAVECLRDGFAEDRACLKGLAPEWQIPALAIYRLPARAWARRLSGHLANELSRRHDSQSLAVLTPRSGGGYQVSVRMAPCCSARADVFCREFAGGGGRHRAGGIDALAEAEVPAFISLFSNYLKKQPS
ncbi:MAG: hypothetical protein JOY84_04230 [Curvibacter sp.]|nr:hypothetical protein [Curvibacter sp.]